MGRDPSRGACAVGRRRADPRRAEIAAHDSRAETEGDMGAPAVTRGRAVPLDHAGRQTASRIVQGGAGGPLIRCGALPFPALGIPHYKALQQARSAIVQYLLSVCDAVPEPLPGPCASIAREPLKATFRFRDPSMGATY